MKFSNTHLRGLPGYDADVEWDDDHKSEREGYIYGDEYTFKLVFVLNSSHIYQDIFQGIGTRSYITIDYGETKLSDGKFKWKRLVN